jgi:hypothetical protein
LEKFANFALILASKSLANKGEGWRKKERGNDFGVDCEAVGRFGDQPIIS